MKSLYAMRRLAALLAFFLLGPVPSWGQVVSVAVGLQPACPYGLGA